MFGNLASLCDKPIPVCLDIAAAVGGYRQMPIDTTNELYREGYADINTVDVNGINYYHSLRNPPYYQQVPGSIPDCLLRISVLSRLRAVNQRLRRVGLELFGFDYYRPQLVQRFFYEQWAPKWLRQVGLTGSQLRTHLDLFWSRPAHSDAKIDLRGPPPHSTGAAIDLTIRFVDTKLPLFMGSMFDDMCEMSFTDYFEGANRFPLGSFSGYEARRNRRLLYWVMTQAGFANYPGEWWHFSWGDQMWAKLLNLACAHYSKMELR